jgi:hypothetical protein
MEIEERNILYSALKYLRSASFPISCSKVLDK